MIDLKEHMQVKWLLTIVDRGKGNRVAEIYRKNHIAVQLIALGKGTASSEIMDYLGLDEPEKELVLSLIVGSVDKVILSQLSETLQFSKPGKGIAFTIPLSGISAGTSRRLEQESGCLMTEEKKEGTTAVERQSYDLIVAVVASGQSDIVMKAAKAAGATGGTVAKAREFGADEEKRILGITVHPERELVMILVPAQDKPAIMKGICNGTREELGESPVVFSLPVDGVTGISDRG